MVIQAYSLNITLYTTQNQKINGKKKQMPCL